MIFQVLVSDTKKIITVFWVKKKPLPKPVFEALEKVVDKNKTNLYIYT